MFLIGFSYWYKNRIGNNEKIKYNCLILLKKYISSGSKCIFKCHHISLCKPSVFLVVEVNFQTLWISNAGMDSALGRWHNCLCPCWLGLSQLLSTSVPLWQSNFHFPSARHSVFFHKCIRDKGSAKSMVRGATYMWGNQVQLQRKCSWPYSRLRRSAINFPVVCLSRCHSS